MRQEVADVLHTLGEGIEQFGFNTHQLRHLCAIKQCRTGALGGHVEGCTACGHLQISYNSCRNRHCPKCQGHKRTAWISQRGTELLPVPYFHVVFTMPGELNTLALHQPKMVYDALFKAAWQTIEAFGKRQGVQMGMISILHTWGQNLSLHPHLHCVVPGGGVDKSGQFKTIRSDGKYLFAVKAMSKVFRAKYVAALRQAGCNDKPLIESLFAKPWVVYAKRPFGNVASVVEYLGRYTHKVAISNSRIQSVSKEAVTFSYKDYKIGGVKKTMTLRPAEFVRRFAQHLLPHRFVRIRHYGILSSTWKRGKLQSLQKQLNVKVAAPTATKLHCCPKCKQPTLVVLAAFGNKGPPSMDLMAHLLTPA